MRRRPTAPRTWVRLVMGVVALIIVSGCTTDGPESRALTLEADANSAERASQRPTPKAASNAASTPTAEPETPTALPTPTAVPVPTATPVPPTPEPIGWIDGECAVPVRAEPDPDRPVYVAELRIDDEARQVSGTTQITFTPDLAIDTVVLRLWPNGPREANAGSSISLSNLRLNGEPVQPASGEDRSRVSVDLGVTVNAGTQLVLNADFLLDVGGEAKARVAASHDWMRLGSFLPLLAWESGVGWAQEPGTAQFAEAVTSPTADWSVQVDAPERFSVLASGSAIAAETLPDGLSRTIWQAEAIRDFALSAGAFTLHQRTVAAPDPVKLQVAVYAGVPEDPVAYADRVEASLTDFSQRYGPYPWPTLTVALTPGIGGGIEFPTHIMLGEGTIGRTTPHEVAHMFFYSLVGNNQARDPWIDEGLASWAEFVHEGRNPAAFGIAPSVNAGQSMEWFAGRSDYYTNAYQQPAVALSSLGSVAEVDCALRILVARRAYGIATNADVLDALGEVFGDVDAVFAQYGITR